MNTAMDRKVREEFERDMLDCEHPIFGYITDDWFEYDDLRQLYEGDYIQGCWVGWCIGKGIIKEG